MRKQIIVLTLIISFLFISSIQVLAEARVVADIRPLTDTSMEITLRWSDSKITTPIRITGWSVESENSVEISYVTGKSEPLGWDTREISSENYRFPMRVILVQQTNEGPVTADFVDLPSNKEAADSIMNLYHQGIVNGYPDGTFRPQANVTRGEFAAMIYRAALYVDDIRLSSNFPDVSTSHWAYPYVTMLSSKGIINGYTNGKYGPEDNVRIGEVMKILDKSFTLFETKTVYSGTLSGHWSDVYFKNLTEKGITKVSDAFYKPYTPEVFATRTQCAVLISRILEQLHEVTQ